MKALIVWKWLQASVVPSLPLGQVEEGGKPVFSRQSSSATVPGTDINLSFSLSISLFLFLSISLSHTHISLFKFSIILKYFLLTAYAGTSSVSSTSPVITPPKASSSQQSFLKSPIGIPPHTVHASPLRNIPALPSHPVTVHDLAIANAQKAGLLPDR